MTVNNKNNNAQESSLSFNWGQLFGRILFRQKSSPIGLFLLFIKLLFFIVIITLLIFLFFKQQLLVYILFGIFCFLTITVFIFIVYNLQKKPELFLTESAYILLMRQSFGDKDKGEVKETKLYQPEIERLSSGQTIKRNRRDK